MSSGLLPVVVTAIRYGLFALSAVEGMVALVRPQHVVLLCAGTAEAGFRSLYSSQGGNDGISPGGNLLRDKTGNLYGTTSAGGGSGCGGTGCGTVFRLAAGRERVLYAQEARYRLFGCESTAWPL